MRKVTLDQYFTRCEDAKHFISVLDNLYPLSEYDIVLEPSAGAGAFFLNLPHNRYGLDLLPLCQGVHKMDFFDYQNPEGKIAVIGNPPFGRRGSMAKKFFQKCANFADVIAFVLPAIFSKPSFYKSLNKNFHLEFEENVNYFVLPDGKEHVVNCVFQVWKRKEFLREDKKPINTHDDFEMIHRHIAWTPEAELKQLSEIYDFAFGQVSHKVCNISDLRGGSQFLIKDVSHHKHVRELFENMSFEHLKKYSMGAISLSRADVIEKYKEVFENKQHELPNKSSRGLT